MKKNFTRLFVSIILFTIFGVASLPRASGQTQLVIPTPLYRFEVSYWDGGHLLTGIYQEGLANGYSFDPIYYLFFDGMGIYVPSPGYTPDPTSGLVPLHRWTVIQDGWRTYYYYSTNYSQQGPDYHYNGVAGYVFPPGQTEAHVHDGFILPLNQLSVFYSQDLGFWNGYGGTGYGFVEPPPNRSGKAPYVYQGVIAACPPTVYDPQFPPQPNPGANFSSEWRVLFYAPGTPPGGGGGGGGGSCNPSSGTVNACHHNGGEWDYESCSCQY